MSSRMLVRVAWICTACLFAAALVACGVQAAVSSGSGDSGGSADAGAAADAGADAEYASLLFESGRVHTVDVTLADGDWSDLLANPTDKTKYQASVAIDGEAVSDVSFSTKGNTSLSSVAGDEDSNRYSFKVNFGKYVDGQTYHGLDKLNLNNLYADATYMKDYLSYEIFRQAGVDAPLTSYVWLTVNGEDVGLYLAVEDVDDSYLERAEGGEGELYKPETEQLGNMDKAGGEGKAPEGMELPEGVELPEGAELPEGMAKPDGDGKLPEGVKAPGSGDGSEGSDGQGRPGNIPFGGFGSGANGADLAYSDDELSSYSDIFDNAVTKASEDDEARVVEALKALASGEDLESCLDTDEVIAYFAAHNFVLNYDSYTGMMLHNYYLYENDGKLSMIPWDYNLAFGAFSGAAGAGRSGAGDADGDGSAASGASDATELVNTGIDTPLSGASADARPMWSWIVENDEYLQEYHDAYDKLLSGYFESGECAAQIDALYEMLLPYIEKDSGAFYSADEFKAAVDTLKQFCSLRAESIRAQLDGTLSTSTDDQDAAARVDASGLSVSAMGSQGAGRGGK